MVSHQSSDGQGRQQAPPTVLLGVTGSIAAYKAVEILRLLIKAGHDVHVVMTPGATKFVGPLTFQGLSGHPVYWDPLEAGAYPMAHLALAEKAKAVIVAPASAESLSHLARGAAGDLVSAALLSIPRTGAGKSTTPVFVAPAMHESMWRHPATQSNIKTLKGYGYQLIGPERGPLGRAGDTGEGRMSDPASIVKQVLRARQ